MEQDYRIAGLRVRMDTFGRTAELAQPYRIETGGTADIRIQSQREYYRGHRPDAPEEMLEYMGTARDFHTKLIAHDGLAMHASAVMADGQAYLFSADSGVGKSTHAALWQRLLGEDRAIIINDDKPVLRRIDGCWRAYGTPWCGKDNLNRNLSAPVGGICFLERGEENAIAPFSSDDLLFRFLRQTVMLQERSCLDRLLTLVDALVQQVPVWKLYCTPSLDAAQLAYAQMTAKQQRMQNADEHAI